MGIYSTTTSLQVYMIGTTFDTLTSALASRCITQGESEVNKYLSKRYNISSFTVAVPPMVTTLTEWLSCGYMYQYMSRGSEEAMARGQAYIDRAIANLQEIQAFKSDLLDTAGSIIADKSDTSFRVLCNTKTYADTFGEDEETNWAVDSDKISDTSGSRK